MNKEEKLKYLSKNSKYGEKTQDFPQNSTQGCQVVPHNHWKKSLNYSNTFKITKIGRTHFSRNTMSIPDGAASEEELNSLDTQLKNLEGELQASCGETKKLEGEIRALTAQPTNEVARQSADQIRQEIAKLEEKLKVRKTS